MEPTNVASREERGIPLSSSIEEAAALFNVSKDTVKDSRTVLADATPETIAKVESGELSVSCAAREVSATTMWWIGDYGHRPRGHAHGERAAALKPRIGKARRSRRGMNAATACFAGFETSSRVEESFRVHQAIALIPDDEWRLKTLAWAAKPAANGKRLTIAAIDDRVREVRAIFSQGWTPDQLNRKARAEAGECVVVNMHDDGTDTAPARTPASNRALNRSPATTRRP